MYVIFEFGPDSQYGVELVKGTYNECVKEFELRTSHEFFDGITIGLYQYIIDELPDVEDPA